MRLFNDRCTRVRRFVLTGAALTAFACVGVPWPIAGAVRRDLRQLLNDLDPTSSIRQGSAGARDTAAAISDAVTAIREHGDEHRGAAATNLGHGAVGHHAGPGAFKRGIAAVRQFRIDDQPASGGIGLRQSGGKPRRYPRTVQHMAADHRKQSQHDGADAGNSAVPTAEPGRGYSGAATTRPVRAGPDAGDTGRQ